MSSQPKGHHKANDKSAEHILVQHGCTQQTTKQHHRTRYYRALISHQQSTGDNIRTPKVESGQAR
eukprot:3755573-Pleurochrysis_carterae.AAC.1